MHWGIHISHVWFSWWRIDNTMPFLLTLGAMFMLSIAYETMSLIRRRMLYHSASTHTRNTTATGAATFIRLLEGIMFAFLILAIVSFNAWVILTIILGSTVGYYMMLNMDEGVAGYSLEPTLHH